MSTPSFFPDFFLVGFPRCGTTSLCSYLAAHPAICFSKPKEPHYFSKLGGSAGGDLQRDYIDRCFAHRRPEHLRAGEGSVSNIYSPEAIEEILSLQPRARFIAMVRNPLDMLLSYHLRMLYLLEEDQPDLARAWKLQSARARGEALPRLCTEPRLLQYGEAGSLGSWLEKLVARAGAQQCLTVVYDDFAADPGKVYERVLRFLDLEAPSELPVFRRKQRSRGYRSRLLQQLLFKPPSAVASLAGVRTSAETLPVAPRAAGEGKAGKAKKGPAARLLRRATRSAGHEVKRLRKRLVRWNSIDVSPRPLGPELREEMRATFAPEIRKLEGLLGRDLGHWG
jgi:sulfotransferase family protein